VNIRFANIQLTTQSTWPKCTSALGCTWSDHEAKSSVHQRDLCGCQTVASVGKVLTINNSFGSFCHFWNN